MNRQGRKLVVVGDGAVGKTTLLTVLVRGEFPTGYFPTLFEAEDHVLDLDVRGELIELALWDTGGQATEEYILRPLTYAGAHAFLMCFSIDWPDSLENLQEKWDPELKHFGAGKVPRFLVGCKTDLRHDERTLRELAMSLQVPVAADRGKEVAKTIGAEYFECSAKTGQGIRELFARVTESMDADIVARFKYKNRYYPDRPRYRNDGCIVV